MLLGSPMAAAKRTPVTLTVAGKSGVTGSRVRVVDRQGRTRGVQEISGGDGRGCIADFATAVVVTARACADTAKVEADGRCTELLEGARQCPHDLVVECAAIERMGMADDAEGGRRCRVLSRRSLDERLEGPGRAREEQPLGLGGLHHGARPQGAGACGAASRTNRRLRRCTYSGALASSAPSASAA